MSEIDTQAAALYSKLYTKYSKLKKEKESACEKLHRQERFEFQNYKQVSEDTIAYLKEVNEKLELQVNELKNELSSRFTKVDEYLQFQKLWMEERWKNAQLLEENNRLKKLLQEESSGQGDDGKAEREQLTTPGSSGSEPNLSNKLATKTKRILMHAVEDSVDPSAEEESLLAAEDISANQPCQITKINEYSPYDFQPTTCCKRVVDGSDVGANPGLLICTFQDLLECIVGMKFSISQNGEFCILVSHQSTGYSFSLTRIQDSSGEFQFRYDVLSLGTLESVATRWMKETITFGLSMCTVFFDRIRGVIKV